jgi:hypothetical protein
MARERKIHWIGSAGNSGYQETACAKLGGYATSVSDEYDTSTCERFEARFKTLQGVTCKSCIRIIKSRGTR